MKCASCAPNGYGQRSADVRILTMLPFNGSAVQHLNTQTFSLRLSLYNKNFIIPYSEIKCKSIEISNHLVYNIRGGGQ